jgi:hypothetical protein
VVRLATWDIETTALLGNDLAGLVDELEGVLAEIDLEGRWVVDLDCVLETAVSGNGLDELGLWAVHSHELNVLAVDDLGLHAESLDGSLTVVEAEGELLIELDGLDESLVGDVVDNLDQLRWDVDECARGLCLDLWEVKLSEDTLGSDHVDCERGLGGADWAGMGDLGLNGHHE